MKFHDFFSEVGELSIVGLLQFGIRGMECLSSERFRVNFLANSIYRNIESTSYHVMGILIA